MRPILYLFIFLLGTLSFAQGNKAFEQANTLYNEGNYTEALNRYTSILEEGEHSAELYYNIANAHYKLNHIAPSIYYYEKALLLKPNDKDILNNIAFAKNMTIDDIEVVPEVGFSRLIKKATNIMVFDKWAKVSVVLVILFVLLFLVYYFSQSTSKKRFTFITSLSFLILALIALSFAFNSYGLEKKNQPAIVFAQESQIKSEPNLRSTEAFKLHEGTKVQVVDTVSNWKKIKLADGKMGWILNDDIKLLKDF
ncbi:tetratricopeptide repeat protein [Psychroserpens sp. Hel_I_66]|uniref:tetratricopeptide repeat protein n=1 Tax=Psychroserpens sp. Hel_I_66 TaxID=1250004 RepID=UPI000648A2F8|nr:tetratricopeptide repeat protein [Psychroserpens sp. Hel_I_66]